MIVSNPHISVFATHGTKLEEPICVFVCVCLWHFLIPRMKKEQKRTQRSSLIAISCCLVAKLFKSFVTLWTLGPARALCSWDFPGKNAAVNFHSLLQGIFPTQGLNPGLPHCRQMLYRLSYVGRFYPQITFNFLYKKCSVLCLL